MIYLLLVLSLSNSLGALAIAAILIVPVLLLGSRTQVLLAGVISVIVLVYPVLRSLDLVPVQEAVAIAGRIEAERAQSLQFRIDNEDALSARAAEKPFAGWGMWGRNQIFDPETGDMVSVTDGSLDSDHRHIRMAWLYRAIRAFDLTHFVDCVRTQVRSTDAGDGGPYPCLGGQPSGFAAQRHVDADHLDDWGGLGGVLCLSRAIRGKRRQSCV